MRFRFWRKPIGARGEDLAARALRKHGYKIIGRNVHLGRYEIDIIARDGDTIAFIEVKTRQSDEYADPAVNVGPKKQEHIRRAAEGWIQHQGEANTYYRYDVVTVLLPRFGRATVDIIQDAF